VLAYPVLRALGWDVGNLEEVQQEYKRRPRDKPVDYALLLLRTPRLFVEAKSLGQNLSDRRWANQIMGYATVAGVEWVVITNGSAATIPSGGTGFCKCERTPNEAGSTSFWLGIKTAWGAGI
jgi:predicted type IV restriction endonuclease